MKHTNNIYGNGGKGKYTMPLTVTATASNGVAYLSIVGRISDWTENSSLEIGRKVDELIAQGVWDLNLYIMSEGGSVFEANEIVNLIKKFKGNKTGKLGALCASAGTYIACHLDTVSMVANGQYMIHKPMGYFEGNEDEVKAKLKVIENITANYKTVYAKRTGKTEDEIETLWSKGDYWMSANEAKQEGFIDGIEDEEEATTELIKVLRACGAPIIPTIKTTTTHHLNYKNMDITLLGFASDAKPTDAEINAKLQELKRKAEDAERLEREAKDKEKEARTKEIKAILDRAEQDKKIIGAGQRANYEKLLNADFDTTKAAIEALNAVELPSKEIGTTQTATTSRKDWKYKDYLEKDPEALTKMRTENPQGFKALADEYYTEK